ncbi:transposase, partial [Nostoc sp.]|uniref:transposase n=1 Tax=Nostoc sp. TaxID=1180 RepID=UPI002FF8E7A9
MHSIFVEIDLFINESDFQRELCVFLYRRRWRVEEAFYTVKRLLSLSYLWTGSINGI